MRPILALLLLLTLAGSAAAQTLADERHALDRARVWSGAAEAQARRFEQAAQAATNDARRARAEREGIVARIAEAQADITGAEARVRIVEALRAAQRARLAAARQPLAGLAAALQTIARRPPALALVQPGTIADAVHVRAVLAAALPVVQERTVALRAEIAEGDRLAAAARDAAAALVDGRRRLDARQRRLAQLETDAAARSASLARYAETETDRAMALGEQARDIVDRMEELGVEQATAGKLARLDGPVFRPPIPGRPAAPPAPPRPYRLPVPGTLVTGYGELFESGIRARGLTLAVAGNARVAAPLPGRVAYAGPFRSYRNILILDHGRGWTSLVTGLDSLAVAAGARVAAGETIGRAPGDRPQVTVEVRHALRPVDPTALIGPG